MFGGKLGQRGLISLAAEGESFLHTSAFLAGVDLMGMGVSSSENEFDEEMSID